MTNPEEGKNGKTLVHQGVKVISSTVAGVSLGIVSGIAAVTAAAVAEVLLPVGLCLWATGLAGGAIGLLFGTKNKKKG